jgi:hypothetical protein
MWEGIIGPIPVIGASMCVGRISLEGVPYIDASAASWKPMPLEDIEMGESVRNF